MTAPTVQSSRAGFGRWGSGTDQYRLGRDGRTHTLNGWLERCGATAWIMFLSSVRGISGEFWPRIPPTTMKRGRTCHWTRTHRPGARSTDMEPSSLRRSFQDSIIATRGYDFQEGQGPMRCLAYRSDSRYCNSSPRQQRFTEAGDRTPKSPLSQPGSIPRGNRQRRAANDHVEAYRPTAQ